MPPTGATSMPDTPSAAAAAKRRPASWFGLLAGFCVLAMAIAISGSVAAFIHPPSILIVVGGTFSAVAVCYSPEDLVQAVRGVGHALAKGVADPGEAALQVLRLAEIARRQGALALQREYPQLHRRPFLLKGITLAVDGLTEHEVAEILGHDLQATQFRLERSAGVLRRCADYAPAMGLIGTLVGLVQMLGNLSNPATIGPSMAIALLTTFYGAVLANMVFSPLAGKLDRNAVEESLTNTLYMLGAVSICRQENPRRLEILLNSVLPPDKRVAYFD